MLGRKIGLLVALLGAAQMAAADTVVVPYTGAFDEASVLAEGGLPAGDYDTIGGLDDVGLFNLVAGTNTFEGSVFTPGDSSDVFLIGIGANQTLTGASINFATNASPFNPLFAFPGPQWTLEESSTTPTIFNIQPLNSPGVYDAPSFSRDEGIYSVLLGNGTFGMNNGDPVDYTMTFTVTEVNPVPLPAAVWLFGSALMGVAGVGYRRKKKAA